MEKLLEIHDLILSFTSQDKILTALRGVDLRMSQGETVCLVGESGSGKSLTALSILKLLSPNARIEGGSVHFQGKDLLTLNEHELRKLRGNEISFIFQEPMISLNPVLTIGSQIFEAIHLHRNQKKNEIADTAIELLEKVGISDPQKRLGNYPHELSGGMLQRVMIAMALASKPKLLIADEPTTALDVTIQAQILTLLRDLVDVENMSLLLITHDLGVVAEMADYIAIMYAGRIIEAGPAVNVFQKSRHPYTRALFSSSPENTHKKGKISSIPGTVPSLQAIPSGCAFHPRCPIHQEICKKEIPKMKKIEEQEVACLFPLD